MQIENKTYIMSVTCDFLAVMVLHHDILNGACTVAQRTKGDVAYTKEELWETTVVLYASLLERTERKKLNV